MTSYSLAGDEPQWERGYFDGLWRPTEPKPKPVRFELQEDYFSGILRLLPCIESLDNKIREDSE